MFSVDKYLTKRFDLHRYNCWHFCRDVWFELTNHLLYDYTPLVTNKYELELAAVDAVHHFVEVTGVVLHTSPPLIVLFRKPKDSPHVGILYKGMVLHLRPSGACYQPFEVASIGFNRVSFYRTL